MTVVVKPGPEDVEVAPTPLIIKKKNKKRKKAKKAASTKNRRSLTKAIISWIWRTKQAQAGNKSASKEINVILCCK